MTRIRRSSTARRKHGTAIVEMAIVFPVLAAILFGISEIGLMFRSATALRAVTRVAARAASKGSTPTAVEQAVASSPGCLDPEGITTILEYREYAGAGAYEDCWIAMGANGGGNDAPLNALVRATLRYDHPLLFPSLWSGFADGGAAGTKRLQAMITIPRG